MKKFIKSKEQKKLKELIPNLILDKIYSSCEIFYALDYFFKHHPNYEEKTKNGLFGYCYSKNTAWAGDKNYCFFIIDNLNNKIHISYNFKLNENLEGKIKYEVTRAFRTSIYNEIQKFKKTFLPGKTKCAITNEILYTLNDCDIDHHNHDFIVIVDLFLKKYNKTFSDLYKYVIEIDSVRYFNNEKLIEYFIDFHNNNTTLRFTKSEANRSKPREIQ